MHENQHRSQVARLRKEMEVIAQSMHTALFGFAEVARHQQINHKYDQLGKKREELATLVGKDASLRVLTEVLEATDQ